MLVDLDSLIVRAEKALEAAGKVPISMDNPTAFLLDMRIGQVIMLVRKAKAVAELIDDVALRLDKAVAALERRTVVVQERRTQ